MKAVTERDIRASFVNCSKGEAKRLSVPRDLATRPWDDLDFLAWTDPSAPERSYLVVERDDRLIGITLRFPSQRGTAHKSMCALCLTTHPGSGVALMTGRKAGESGRQGNSVGIYLCADLACSLYLRGKKAVDPGGRFVETLSVDEKIERTRTRLFAFLDKLIEQ